MLPLDPKAAILSKALQAIADYAEKKKPTDLGEARFMLSLIGIIASESLKEAA